MFLLTKDSESRFRLADLDHLQKKTMGARAEQNAPFRERMLVEMFLPKISAEKPYLRSLLVNYLVHVLTACVSARLAEQTPQSSPRFTVPRNFRRPWKTRAFTALIEVPRI
jgi:hypothetical protein